MTTRQNLTAIIYDKKGRVLSIGKNSYVKTHPLMAKYGEKVGEPNKLYLHAEIQAILKCKDLSKAHSIFVSRYNKHGHPALAAPCRLCQEAIKQSGIRKVLHT
jgi:tRNA(Arg) A34 adenosine deaminase TadA